MDVFDLQGEHEWDAEGYRAPLREDARVEFPGGGEPMPVEPEVC